MLPHDSDCLKSDVTELRILLRQPIETDATRMSFPRYPPTIRLPPEPPFYNYEQVRLARQFNLQIDTGYTTDPRSFDTRDGSGAPEWNNRHDSSSS